MLKKYMIEKKQLNKEKLESYVKNDLEILKITLSSMTQI